MQFTTVPIDITDGVNTKDDKYLRTGNDAMKNVSLSGRRTPQKRKGFDSIDPQSLDFQGTVIEGPLENINEVTAFGETLIASSDKGTMAGTRGGQFFNRNEPQLGAINPVLSIVPGDAVFGASFSTTSAVPSYGRAGDIVGINFGGILELFTAGGVKYTEFSRGGQSFHADGDELYIIGASFASPLDRNDLKIQKARPAGTVPPIGAFINPTVPEAEYGLNANFSVKSDEDFFYIATFPVTGDDGKVIKINKTTGATTAVEFSMAARNITQAPGLILTDTEIFYFYVTSSGTPGFRRMTKDLTLGASGVFSAIDGTGGGLASTDGIALPNGDIGVFMTTGTEERSLSGYFIFRTAFNAISFGGTIAGFRLLSYMKADGFRGDFFGRVRVGSITGADGRTQRLYNYCTMTIDFTVLTGIILKISGIAKANCPSLAGDASPIIMNQFDLIGFQDGVEELRLLEYTKDRSSVGQSIEHSGITYIPGALPMTFDGNKLATIGFHVAPQIFGSSTASGSVPAGTYDYVAVFSRTRANGAEEISAISNVRQVTLGSASKVTLNIRTPYCRIEGCNIKVYRKTSAQTSYRLAITQRTSIPILTSVSVEDDAANISGNPVLTAGFSELENDPLPAVSCFTFHQNRLFAHLAYTKDVIAFSKPTGVGVNAEFSDFQTIAVQDGQGRNSGKIGGLASLDNKLIVLKEASIFAIFGEGPNALGAGASFSRPELVSSESGCNNPRSVLNAGFGVMYQGQKGIYAVTRSLSVEYIGDMVEGFNDRRVSSSILMPDSNQIRLGLADGPTLVYNYQQGKWTTHETGGHLAAVFAGSYVTATPDNIRVEKNGFDDDGNFIPMEVTTGWLKLDSIQGFGRVQKAFILGEYKSQHKLKVRVSYDYQDYTWDEYELTPQNADYNITTKPNLVNFQNGANDGVYKWSIHMQKQKCSAIKLTIIDEEDGAPGESFVLSSLELRVGLKPGAAKYPVEKTD